MHLLIKRRKKRINDFSQSDHHDNDTKNNYNKVLTSILFLGKILIRPFKLVFEIKVIAYWDDFILILNEKKTTLSYSMLRVYDNNYSVNSYDLINIKILLIIFI